MLLLTAEFDQILGFPPWFYALCWDLRFWNCILTAFKFLEVFPFCWNMNEGITTHKVFFYNRISSREFKSATTLQRLICHSNTTLIFISLSRRRLTPFFFDRKRLKIVANENYNRVEHRVDWHLALCPIVSCALKRPLSRTMSPKRYKHEQKMPATIHCQKHLKREPSEQFSCFFRPSY